MRSRTTTQIRHLRRTIDSLPVRTREAMLVGINNNTIVVGAYTTNDGVCPMLAAHRNGGRTSFIQFAKAWDEFCFRGIRAGRRKPRPATRTELATLRSHIESSLLAEGEEVVLNSVMAEHLALKERHRAEDERELARSRRIAARAAAEVEAERAARAGRDAERREIEREQEPEVPLVAAASQSPRPGDPDRSRELKGRHGWRWMKVVRSYDEYRETLAELDAQEANQAATERERELTQSRH